MCGRRGAPALAGKIAAAADAASSRSRALAFGLTAPRFDAYCSAMLLSDFVRALDWEFYDNPLRAWLTALAVLVGGVAALLLLKQVVVKRLERFAKHTATSLDDLAVDILQRTRVYFIVLVALRAAALTLTLPESVQRGIYLATIVAVCLQAVRWGNGVINFWVERYTTQKAGTDAATVTTVTALGYLGRILLWAFILLVALDNFGYDVTALITGLGITGIAVALAVQNILGDILASLSIVIDKPFVVGDYIVVDQYQGTVENVGLKTTRVRSLSGEQIIFSNGDLLKARIRNFKRLVERRASFVTGVNYGTPPDLVGRIPAMLREIVSAQPHVRFERSHFRGYGESALECETVYFMLTDDYNKYMDTQQTINLGILRRFEAEGIDFAFPTRTIITRVEGTPIPSDGAPNGAAERAALGGSV